MRYRTPLKEKKVKKLVSFPLDLLAELKREASENGRTFSGHIEWRLRKSGTKRAA